MLWEGLYILYMLLWNEPPHDKTNNCGCAHSEDSDQLGHPPSLIRVFAVRMKKAWSLAPIELTAKMLIRLGGCPVWSESSLGAHSLCWFCHEAAQMFWLQWSKWDVYYVNLHCFCHVYAPEIKNATNVDSKSRENITFHRPKIYVYFRFQLGKN